MKKVIEKHAMKGERYT